MKWWKWGSMWSVHVFPCRNKIVASARMKCFETRIRMRSGNPTIIGSSPWATLTAFRLSSMYIGRSSVQDRDVSDNNSGSARASPRIPNLDNDCPPLKRPKIEPDTDVDDQRQVSQLHIKRANRDHPPHVIINLEDWPLRLFDTTIVSDDRNEIVF